MSTRRRRRARTRPFPTIYGAEINLRARDSAVNRPPTVELDSTRGVARVLPRTRRTLVAITASPAAVRFSRCEFLHETFLLICLQAKAGRGAGPRGNDTNAFGEAQEGGGRAERYVSHMSENQVRRRRRPHLQLLRHTVLRTLRRKGHSTVEQGKRIPRERDGAV